MTRLTFSNKRRRGNRVTGAAMHDGALPEGGALSRRGASARKVKLSRHPKALAFYSDIHYMRRIAR
jgi:hypothetical protein